jgi:hypothetical protein
VEGVMADVLTVRRLIEALQALGPDVLDLPVGLRDEDRDEYYGAYGVDREYQPDSSVSWRAEPLKGLGDFVLVW